MSAQGLYSKEEVTRAAHEWRDLNARNALDEEKSKAFEAWLAADLRHEQAYDRAITVWAAVEYLQAEDIDDDLLSAATLKPDHALTDRLSAWIATTAGRTVSATFTFVLVVSAAFWTMAKQQTDGLDPLGPDSPAQRFATTTGEVRTVTLPDGSRATLGASTALSFTDRIDFRDVRLDRGAVYFEVVSDPARQFRVEADEMVTMVTGTAFEMRKNGNISRVAVSEGTVSVSYPIWLGGRKVAQRKRVDLSAGMQVSALATQGLSDKQSIEIDNIGAWRTERLIYDGATLSELLADVERYAGVIVEIDSALDLEQFGRVSASFNSKDIASMTETLANLFPISIAHEQPGRLRVGPKGGFNP
ncbi:MAG: FecR domain-containing protein [Pseudomonadota bacterium]